MPPAVRLCAGISVLCVFAGIAGAQSTQTTILRSGSSRLVRLQADRTADNAGNGFSDADPDDGGWDHAVNISGGGHSANPSPPNTTTVTSIGLAMAFRRGAANYNAFISCLDAYLAMASDPAIVSGADGTFLYLMNRLGGDPTFAQEARDKWNLAIDSLGGGDVNAAAQAIKQRRVAQGFPALYPWDISWFVISASRLDRLFPGEGFLLNGTIFAQAILNDLLSQTPTFDVFDASQPYYDIGVIGACIALRVVALSPGQYNALLDRILSRQNVDGSWGWNDTYPEGNPQTTAYAVIASRLFRNRADANAAKLAGANYLASLQMSNGGFHYYCGGDEVTEADGEILFALSLVAPVNPPAGLCPANVPPPACLTGPGALGIYYSSGPQGILNLSSGQNWVVTLTNIDGSLLAGNRTHRLLIQDQGAGSGFETLSLEIQHDASGSGGHLLQSKDTDFTVRSTHAFNAGEVPGTFDLRVELIQGANRRWDVSPYFRLPGGGWTLFSGGSWTTVLSFDLTQSRLAVQLDGSSGGRLCHTPPTAQPRPPAALRLLPIEIQIAVPAAPVFTSTNPASPANSNSTLVIGTAEAGATVRLFTASDCSGSPVATGLANGAGNFSIGVTVADNTTTTFYGTATDAAMNASFCSASGITYVEDSQSPVAPVLTGTSPPSPSNDNNPILTGTAEAGSTVRIYTAAGCGGSAVAQGTANLFGAFNVPVAVADDSTTTFFARVTDPAGNVSPCSVGGVTYVEDSQAPAPPTLTGTSPASPANNNNPSVVGTAVPNSTIQVYATSDCSGSPAGTGAANGAGAFSVAVTVADNTSTTFFATATDAAGNPSACSAGSVTYVEDSQPPAEPTLTGTSPASPSNDNNPSVLGTAESNATIRVYSNSNCAGAPAGTAAASGAGAFSVAVTVADNSTTTFYATATDAAGNLSSCSASSVTYVEDSAGPAVPTLVGSSPASPANNNNPSITGSADPNSTIRVYPTSNCSGAPAGTATANGAGAFSVPVTVADDSTTTFYATASDSVGNTSACSSSSVMYVEDSTAPAAPTLTGSSPASPANNNNPSISGTAEANSTVRIYATSNCSGPPAGTGTANGAGAFSISVTVANDSTTTFYATATDAALNVSTCSGSSVVYVEDSTAPAAPTPTGTSPVSPANNNSPSILGTAEPNSVVRLYTASDCSGPAAASGTADGTGAFSISRTIPDNVTFTVYATATDPAGNVSTCSTTSVTYVEDSAAPAAPTLTGSSPVSPANNNNPSISGTAEANSTVRIYPTSDCSGAPAGTGTASGAGSFGISVTVASDSTTTFYATATDAAGNGSTCSTTSVTYIEDSLAPTFAGATGAAADSATQITVSWSSATDSVTPSASIVYEICASTVSGACGTSFSVSDTTTPGATSWQIGGLTASTTYFFVVRARDQAGNRDANTTEVSATTLP